MKIISTTETGLLVDITTQELANTLWYSSFYQMQKARGDDACKAGKEYNLSERVGYISEVENIEQTLEDFNKVVDKMKRTQTALRDLAPVIASKFKNPAKK